MKETPKKTVVLDTDYGFEKGIVYVLFVDIDSPSNPDMNLIWDIYLEEEKAIAERERLNTAHDWNAFISPQRVI